MSTLTRVAAATVAALVVLAGVTPFALVAPFGLVGTASAATITVNDNGGADYTSIQDAVDAAAPGDTIRVAPGEYDESVTINKQLTLIGDPGDGSAGAGSSAPVMDGGPSAYAFKLTSDADGTTITGFLINNNNNDAVLVDLNDDGDTLDGFTFSHNSVVGPTVDFDYGSGTLSMSNVNVVKNDFTASKIDVNGDSPSSLTIDGLTIAENTFTESKGDLMDFDLESGTASATITIRGNTIMDASADAIEFELDPDDSHTITITKNEIYRSGEDAIEFLDNGDASMTTRIEYNDIRDSGGAAVDVDSDGDASRITVRRNNIVGNGAGVQSAETDAAQVIDARGNYWGTSSGPSSASGTLYDPVATSTAADGSGDSVSGPLDSSDLANVRFVNYATSPLNTGSGSAVTTSVGGANFDIGDASFSTSNPVVGQAVTISVPVTNTGDNDGKFSGMFRSDMTGHDIVEFRVGSGDTRTATTTVVYDRAGTYNVRLDNEFVGALTVTDREPMSVNVAVDEANSQVVATVDNPRQTAIDIAVPAVNATRDSGITLTNVQVTPAGIDDFDLAISQASLDDGNASNMTMLPDGTTAVSSFVFDSSLDNEDIESVELTFDVNTTRYAKLADATTGDEITMHRYDDETGNYTAYTGEVLSVADGSLTASVALGGFSTYVYGVDRSAFAVTTRTMGNPVTTGDSVTMVFEVTNVGDGPGLYAPTVGMADQEVETEGLVLAPGESDTLTVELETSTVGAWFITADGKLVGIAFVEPAAE
ncbi:right-handed parallel beta-helix repeat-containing protein [Halorarius litoreus]|uniref:right-handed parallel beta-helix repeat-containing protein n=1 Tax=Halorarius litoreus TaxID=2962676 RepID=UPI0020CF0D26|nr:right-handed parallel beta-helix repeat-containing protein [Halorarius litoreus]